MSQEKTLGDNLTKLEEIQLDQNLINDIQPL